VATRHGAPAPPARSRIAKLGFLVFGLSVAAYLGSRGPREQHVNLVLGDQARDVSRVLLQYVDDEGEIAREARFAYPPAAAPRVVAHEPHLPDGSYRLKVDLDTRDRRVSVERQVTLGGGSTQVDLSAALAREPLPPSSP
jgi:hypothetical protein